jgi:hypothetical protein
MNEPLDRNIAIRALIVDASAEWTERLHAALMRVNANSSASVSWDAVASVEQAYSTTRARDRNLIFVDLLSTGLRDSVSFVRHMRHTQPSVVFVLFSDPQALEEHSQDIYVGWGARLRHYYLLPKSVANFDQQVSFNLARAQLDIYAYGSRQTLEIVAEDAEEGDPFTGVQLSKLQAQISQLTRQLATLRPGLARRRRHDDPQAFVIMSFNPDLRDVWELGIRETLARAGFLGYRVDEDLSNRLIIESIYEEIHASALVIAELTDPRPNCYYELGFADALNKEIVRIAREGTPLPFDINQYPVLFYRDVTELRRQLTSAIKRIQENREAP